MDRERAGRAEEEKRRAEEEERARKAEEVRRQQEQAEKQRQELQKQASELNNNRQNMSDEEYSMKRQELTLKDNGFNDLQSKLDAEKYGNSKVSDSLKINGEGEEGRHQFNIGKIAHKLFDGSDADNLSIEQMAKRWGELNGNDQQDIASNLKTLQYRYTQEGKEQEALSTARLLGDLERYGGKAKDRDFLNSLVTNAKHGGFAGDIASNIEQTLGNVTGQGEKFREILNARQNDMDSLDGWNKAGNTIGNIVFDTGANLVSGGAKMALDTGMGAINIGEKALDEKVLDENGKIRNHNLEEQAGLIGSELVTDGLRLAGAKGLTPSLDKVADLMRSGSDIKQILPEVAKYGAKELGTVLPTSYLQTNLNVMGNGGHFGDAKLEDIAKDTAMNIGTDLAMDIRSGLGRARTGGDVKQLYHDGKLLPNTGLTPNAGKMTFGGMESVKNPYKSNTSYDPKSLIEAERNAVRTGLFNKNNANSDLSLADKEFNVGAPERLAKALRNGADGDVSFMRMPNQLLGEVNAIRQNIGQTPLKTNEITAYKNAVNNHLNKRVLEGMSPETVAHIAADSFINPYSKALPVDNNGAYDRSHIQMAVSGNLDGKYNTTTFSQFGDNISLKNITPRKSAEIKNLLQRREEILNSSSDGGAGVVPSSTDVGGAPFSAGRTTYADNIAQKDQKINDSVKYRLPNDNSNLSEVNYTETEGTPIYRGQAQADRGIVKNLKIEDGEINDFIKDQVKKQNSQNKIPLKEKLADNVANLKHYLIDDAVAHERYTKDKALKKELREGVDRVRSSETIASQFIRDTGLSEALGKMSKEEQNEFSQYLIAKRHLEVADRDIATGRDLNIDKAIVDKFSEKYKVAEEVYRNHNKAMLEHMAEHGLISSELKDKLIAENPNYAPLQRIMDEAENFSGNSKQLGNLSNQSVVKGLKGSERVVDNPLEATLNNTFRMINEVERNKVARSLAENVFGGDNVEVTRDMPNWAKQPNMDIDSYSPRGETVNKIVDYEGRKAVELEDYITDRIPENVNNRNFIRKEILDKFRGKNLTIQDGEDANITRNGAGKLAGASYKGQSEEHVDTKINSSMYIDELGLTVRNLHEVENTKDSGRNANRYIKGDTTIISRGKPYEAELVIKKAPNGNNQIYDVVIKKDTPSSLPSGDITMSATSLGVPRLSGETKFSTSSLPDRKGIVKGLRLGETEKLAYLDNGKKVEIEVPKLVAKEMKNLNGVLPDGLDKVISVLAMPAKTLRAGATGLNPIFVASNLVRDQIQSAISGGVISSLKGTPEALLATFGRGEKANALKAELARAGLGGSEYRVT